MNYVINYVTNHVVIKKITSLFFDLFSLKENQFIVEYISKTKPNLANRIFSLFILIITKIL